SSASIRRPWHSATGDRRSAAARGTASARHSGTIDRPAATGLDDRTALRAVARPSPQEWRRLRWFSWNRDLVLEGAQFSSAAYLWPASVTSLAMTGTA